VALVSRQVQNTLRTLADETGGLAIINQNDFDSGLKRIDADTSDYYVLAYYSKNPSSTRPFRQLDVRVKRSDVTLSTRKEYMVKPSVPAVPSRPVPPSKP
jgi:VWFA-related protein